jgi:tRNA dimethylallyltransferase
MRLLERIHAGDDLTPRKDPRYDVLKLGVTWPRPILCDRIDERLDRRMAEGMVEEVQSLMDNGATPEFLDKLGLEYRYLYRYLAGIMSLDEALEELARKIKAFAKRQMIWFRKDKSIIWLDMANDPMAQASEAIERFLEE